MCKKFVSLCLALMLGVMFTASCPASASEAHPLEKAPEVISSVAVAETPKDVLSVLDKYDISYNESSKVQVVLNNDDPSGVTSTLQVVTETGDEVEVASLTSFKEQDGTLKPDNFAQELLAKVNNPFKPTALGDFDYDTQTREGVRIVTTARYNRIWKSNQRYIRPLSHEFVCYNDGAKVSTSTMKVTLMFVISGISYKMSNTDFVHVSDSGYLKGDFSQSNPTYGKTYSHSVSNPNSLYITCSDFGYIVETEFLINGNRYQFDFCPYTYE